jgi:hypothetical protein
MSTRSGTIQHRTPIGYGPWLIGLIALVAVTVAVVVTSGEDAAERTPTAVEQVDASRSAAEFAADSAPAIRLGSTPALRLGSIPAIELGITTPSEVRMSASITGGASVAANTPTEMNAAAPDLGGEPVATADRGVHSAMGSGIWVNGSYCGQCR